MKLFIFVLVSVSLVLLARTDAAGITINTTAAVANASDLIGVAANEVFTGTAIPTSTTLDAVDGNAHSKNVIDWLVNGGQTVLSFNMDHKRNGSTSSHAITYVSPLTFTANSNATYELSGYFNVTDVGASGSVFHHVQLSDVTAGVALFSNQQVSINTINEQFVVGGSGGDDFNFGVGSLTGPLTAGHVYNLYLHNEINAIPFDDSGASAVGNLTLKIVTVPEPSSVLLCLAAILATAKRRKKR